MFTITCFKIICILFFLLFLKLKIGGLMEQVNIVGINRHGGQNLIWIREISRPGLYHLMDIMKIYSKVIESFKIRLMEDFWQNG